MQKKKKGLDDRKKEKRKKEKGNERKETRTRTCVGVDLEVGLDNDKPLCLGGSGGRVSGGERGGQPRRVIPRGTLLKNRNILFQDERCRQERFRGYTDLSLVDGPKFLEILDKGLLRGGKGVKPVRPSQCEASQLKEEGDNLHHVHVQLFLLEQERWTIGESGEGQGPEMQGEKGKHTHLSHLHVLDEKGPDLGKKSGGKISDLLIRQRGEGW